MIWYHCIYWFDSFIRIMVSDDLISFHVCVCHVWKLRIVESQHATSLHLLVFYNWRFNVLTTLKEFHKFLGGAGQTHTCKDIMTSESTLLSFNTCPNGIVWGNRNAINIAIGSKRRKLMVKSPKLDESGEGAKHDHRSQRTKAVTWTHWALQADRWDLAKTTL